MRIKDGVDQPLHENLRTMLQINTQTRLRINEEETAEDLVAEPEVSIGEGSPADEQTVKTRIRIKIKIRTASALNFLQMSCWTMAHWSFILGFLSPMTDGIYAEVDGAIHNCSVNGDMVKCDLTGFLGDGI